jgi:hypothetical protein
MDDVPVREEVSCRMSTSCSVAHVLMDRQMVVEVVNVEVKKVSCAGPLRTQSWAGGVG